MSKDAQPDEIKRMSEMIKDIDFAMLTTQEHDGTLRSRPMSTQEVEFDGDLWFFTGMESGKVAEIKEDQQVNVSYADKDEQRYVSVSGKAKVLRDQQKIDELWSPALKVWFPNGKDDPNVGLIKVDVTQAEYWDSSSNSMVRVAQFAKALVTGDHEDMGKNRKINL